MTQDLLIAPPTWSTSECVTVATTEHCCAFLTGVPPVYEAISTEQGWTLPCVITEDETGAVTAWRAV